MNAISRYFLYGEDLRRPDLDLLHIEAIPLRSSAHNWTIRPHSHPAHLQLLLVEDGGGRISIETETWAIDPPCLVVIPVGHVHEIHFLPGTQGKAITVASSYSRDVAVQDHDVQEAFCTPAVYRLDTRSIRTSGVADAFGCLMQEFGRAVAGRHLALRAHFERILVAVLRLHKRAGGHAQPDAFVASHLVERYRDLVEENFRTQKRIGFYSGRLGVTSARLNAACRRCLDLSATKLLHERVIIEAKRGLLYSHQSVSEIAYALGFHDEAYFNRFFSHRVGAAPGRFRTRILENRSEP